MASPVLFARDEGPRDGPAVVLLHSLATSGALWDPQASIWAESWRVIRIDLPGHGRSPGGSEDGALGAMADRVAATLDALDVARWSLVGLSLGGMVAQAIALRTPDRVAAMVLAHCGARTDAAVREIWNRRLAQLEAGGMAGQVAPTLERWFPVEFVRQFPLTMEWVGGMIRRTPRVGYEAAIRAIQGLDHVEALRTLRVPALIVAGTEDTAVPPQAAEALSGVLPNAELDVLEGVGHIGNVQAPGRFTERVGAFLRQSI